MHRHIRRAIAALTTLLTALAMASPAAASSNVLTYYDANAVSVGDVLSAGLASGTAATFYTTTSGSTGVRCTTSTITFTVTSNPVAPGTATMTVSEWLFGNCTVNIIGTTGVQNVTMLNLPYGASVTSSSVVTVFGGSSGPLMTRIVLNTILGTVTCEYAAYGNSSTAIFSNGSLSFVNQRFDKATGSAVCPTILYFTARYGPLVGTSVAGSPLVLVN